MNQKKFMMEIITRQEKKTDIQLLMITHLSQLLTFVTGFGGLIVPLIIWLTKKDEIIGMDAHGKAVVNFQITMFLAALVSVPLILLFGLGILTLIFIGVISIVLPIVNAIKASNGESPSLFCTFQFIE